MEYNNNLVLALKNFILGGRKKSQSLRNPMIATYETPMIENLERLQKQFDRKMGRTK